ncbi:transposase [Streptomyces shenzhenensis]|uniref:transposase n=1 Tax=Streptomyces shenzhenensis TaxID=943815 RepID=UPI0033F4EC87
MARFTKSQCRPCPVRTRCTTTADSARTVGFPPRELRDLQLRVRTEQQTPDWKTRYAVRSGVEGTINEFAHGHGMRPGDRGQRPGRVGEGDEIAQCATRCTAALWPRFVLAAMSVCALKLAADGSTGSRAEFTVGSRPGMADADRCVCAHASLAGRTG